MSSRLATLLEAGTRTRLSIECRIGGIDRLANCGLSG